MTTGQRIFSCGECGGDVRTATGAGRTYEYRPGIKLPIPEAFPTAVCDECGELYLTTEEAEQLEQALEESFAQYCGELVDTACSQAGVTIRDLEKAAGVTHTYLSKVRNGKQASVSLLRLLQAFARHPDEVNRNLEGRDYRDALEDKTKPNALGRMRDALEQMRAVTSAEVLSSLETFEVDSSFEAPLPDKAVPRAINRPRRAPAWNEDDDCIVTGESSSTALAGVA